jgi:RNA polymerase sigma factor (sigma-70 family)
MHARPVETLDSSPPRPAPIPGFAALYRDHFGFVWSSLLRMGVPMATVEDALQDVFAIAHRRLPTFEGRSSVRSWLFGIVRRVAFRQRRTRERADRKHRAWAPHAENRAQARAELDELVDQRQLCALLLRALDELDGDKRAAITLHVFEELSGPEVAQMLGLNVDTAYSRIKAGRRALQRTLEGMGVGPQRDRLVDATLRHTQPPKGAQRRVAALLAVRLATGSTSAPAPAIAAWKATAAGLVLGSAALLTLALTGDRGPRPDPPAAVALHPTSTTPAERGPSPGPTPTEPPHAAVAPDPPPASLVGTTPAPVPPHRPADPSVSAPAAPVAPLDEDALRREVALLTSAKAALDRGEPRRALERLADHARSFAHGQLVMEREAYRAIALCDLEQTTQGRGEAQLFLRRYPRATVAARVAEACDVPRQL